MRISYNRSIGGITGGLIVFTLFMVNLIAFLGGCCCYRSCKKRYPVDTEPLNTQPTVLKSKNLKFNVAPPAAGDLTDMDIVSRNMNTDAENISSISQM